MKLWQLFKNLPLPLFISSLTLVCTASPVQSVELAQLNPDNFKSSTANGVWFIEHFSPYCGHCRHFAPTWEELVKYNDGHPELGIKLAQVNCAVHGDLCDSNNVKGYPQMNMYRDGDFVETFRGARELDRLTDYLKKHSVPQAAPVVDEKKQEPHTAPETPVIATNPSGTVLVLDDKTFQSTVEQGPIFIKFFAPWCGHCKKLAPTWKNLARNMQNKLAIAEVDCEAHKALCATQNIEGFPTLKFYTAGSSSEYHGGRKLEQLKEFAEKASGSISRAVTAAELEELVSEDNVAYALLYSSQERGLLSALRPLFAPLLGSPTVYTIVDPPSSLTSRLSIDLSSNWALVSFKDHDFTRPSAIYTSSLSAFSLSESINTEPISKWLVSNRLPTTIELTQDTFQSVMNSPSRPLVVLAAVTKDNKAKVQERLEEVGKMWRSRTDGTGRVSVPGGSRAVVFAWMDLERWKDWMKSMYGLTKKDSKDLEDVDIVITDHQKLLYYDVDASNTQLKLTSSQNIFATIEGAADGRIKAKNSENIIERTARYLNAKLVAIEKYIINNLMYTLFFILCVAALIVVALRRVLADDSMDQDYGRLSKGERLD